MTREQFAPPAPEVQHLPTLLRRVQAGEIRVPAFQRDYVWTEKQIIELLESIYNGYPIGSLLFWQPTTTSIAIKEDALNVVKLLQKAGRVTSLAVKRFQAEVEKNQSRLFDVKQQIIGIENRVNFLAGRTPLPVARWSDRFLEWVVPPVRTGLPSQLLANRPDIRQA